MPRSPEFVPTTKALIVSDKQLEVAQQWLAAGRTVGQVIEAMGVSRPTYYSALKRANKSEAPPALKKA